MQEDAASLAINTRTGMKLFVVMLIIAALRLAGFFLVPLVVPTFERELIHYRDLAYYLDEGRLLLYGDIATAREQLGYLANPLWAVVIATLTRNADGYRQLWPVAFILSLLRDVTLLHLCRRWLGRWIFAAAFLLAVLPYPFVYSFNFSSDLLASLAVVFFVFPFFSPPPAGRSGALRFGAATLMLMVLSLVRASLLPLAAVAGGFAATLSWREIRSRDRRLRAGATASVLMLSASFILAVSTVTLTWSYLGTFSNISRGMGRFAYEKVVAMISRMLPLPSVAQVLAAIATPVLHLGAFLMLREQAYLSSTLSRIDVIVLLTQAVVLLPAMAAMIRRPFTIVTIAFLALFLPSAYGVAHARYSFPLHPVLAVLAICLATGGQQPLEDLGLHRYFSRRKSSTQKRDGRNGSGSRRDETRVKPAEIT